jgi:7-carboxy-7-deazaguanine synthase
MSRLALFSPFPNENATVRLAQMAGNLVINEIYLSVQGESSFAGLPCIFVRLTGCDLRCSYCDTAYAFTGGKKRTIDECARKCTG